MRPRIYYFAYDHQRPNGGQKDTYQHVDILNSNGYEAYALHRAPGFRLTWFEHSTRVIDDQAFRKLWNSARDVVVLPEDLGPGIARYPGRKVIFNKNLYHGFRALAAGGVADPYREKDVLGVFAVSRHNQTHLQFAYPNRRICLVHYDLRLDRFPFRPLEEKLPVIACVPKCPSHIAVLHEMLRARAAASLNRFAEFEWRMLDGLSERSMAEVLGSAYLLVFLSVEEGLPRTPLEAMASGSLVAAYAQGPLCEYLPGEYGFAHGDLVGMARYIEDVTNQYPNPVALRPVVDAGRAIAARYSRERQTASVLEAWRTLLD